MHYASAIRPHPSSACGLHLLSTPDAKGARHRSMSRPAAAVASAPVADIGHIRRLAFRLQADNGREHAWFRRNTATGSVRFPKLTLPRRGRKLGKLESPGFLRLSKGLSQWESGKVGKTVDFWQFYRAFPAFLGLFGKVGKRSSCYPYPQHPRGGRRRSLLLSPQLQSHPFNRDAGLEGKHRYSSLDPAT